MVKKLSAKGMLKLEKLEEANRKLDRIKGLIAKYAIAIKGQDAFLSSISRAATDVSRVLLTGGYGVMSDSLNQIAQLARRGGDQRTKTRYFQEHMAGLGATLERAVREVNAEKREGPAQAEEEK